MLHCLRVCFAGSCELMVALVHVALFAGSCELMVALVLVALFACVRCVANSMDGCVNGWLLLLDGWVCV